VVDRSGHDRKPDRPLRRLARAPVGRRLDFTVIGRAVNEACRVEDMCKPLRTPLLLTRPFVDACGIDSAVSLGETELRGVTTPIELFALAD